jgi:hypothetical protein
MDQGAVVGIYLKNGSTPDATMKALQDKIPEVTAYLAEDIPKYLNYSGSPDRPDILLVAKHGKYQFHGCQIFPVSLKFDYNF